MDPSIMKLLEDDEDESMHSGADVDALSAELTRDIGGDTSAMVPPIEPDTGILGQASISAPKQDFIDWQSSSQEENNRNIQQNEETQQFQPSKQLSSQEDFIQQGLGSKTQDLQARCQNEPERPPSQSDHHPQQSEAHALQEIERDQANKRENTQSSDISQGLNQEVPQQPENQQQHIGQQLNSQQVSMSSQASMEMRKMKGPASIPFHMLLPILRPHLDKDRSMQLQAVFNKLRNNEVSKEGFLRVIRNIVGDQMLRQAATKVQLQVARNAPANANQYPLQAHDSSHQHPISGGQQISELQSFSPVNSMSSSQSMKNAQMQAATSFSETVQNSRETDSKSDFKGVQVHSYPANASLQAVKQLQSAQTSHAPFSVYGGTPTNFNAFPYSTPSLNSQPSSIRPVNQDMHMRQASHTQGITSTQARPYQAMTSMTAPRPEMPNTASETKKQHTGLVAGHSASQQNPAGWQSLANKDQRTSAFPSVAFVKQEVVDQPTESSSKSQFTAKDNSSFGSMHFNQGNSVHGSLRDEVGEKQPSKVGLTSSTSMIGRTQVSAPMVCQVDQSDQNQKQSLVSSTTPQLQAVTTAKTPLKKPSVGQKKPLEAPGSSPPMSNKKQKTSGTFLDQSIEQLNDVTAVSGVNLREEEEQLLSAPKEDSRASEATRRVVQEEEERLILQKGPLLNKLEKIMLKHGVKTISSEAMRCLSLCVEERLRGLLTILVRLSKQRVDIEKTKHRFCITSDVQSQISLMNKKAKEEWDKKQTEEAEKLRKPNEGEGSAGLDADKDKDENRSKNLKANKEEDDKMRTTAANVAARAAVGGDDMLSKWQLMAEQARQKREGLDVASSGSQLGKSSTSKHAHNSGKRSRDQDSEKKGSAGGMRKFGRNPAMSSHLTIARTIAIKDVIAALEREPQMSRSTLIYRMYLYEKPPSSSAEQS